MSLGSTTRKRADRVAALELPPGAWARAMELIQRPDVLLRVGLCALAALLMWFCTFSWAPPYPYRVGTIPLQALTARVEFSVTDPVATRDAKLSARKNIRAIYVQDPQPLIALRHTLKERMGQVVLAESFEKLDKNLWLEFQPPLAPTATMPENMGAAQGGAEDAFLKVRLALTGDANLAKFDEAVKRAMEPWTERGLIEKLTHGEAEAVLSQIDVKVPGGTLERVAREEVSPVGATEKLRLRLETEFTPFVPEKLNRVELAERVAAWLKPRLPTTLTFDKAATELAAQKAEDAVLPVPAKFAVGQLLAPAKAPITAKEEELLRAEHTARLAAMTVSDYVLHSLADLGMYFALYVLCGVYIAHREPQIIANLRQFMTLLGLVVVAVTAACLVSYSHKWASMIALLLFGMTVTLAYQRELALILSTCVALVTALTLGQELDEFVVLVAGVSAAVLAMGRIRNRTRLLYVGMVAGAVASLTALGVGTLIGQPLLVRSEPTDAWFGLVISSAWCGFFALLAGLFMTGLLPFIERLFDVQTEMRLLELGDAAHPLLQELVRRAPGTYNHSINVASIAEAAAEAIGCNGLLVRVGAYFHDIGKMFKPSYFVENQGVGGNRHESLLPAMSTLVIIAHVKDGADLARQHNLPQAIIDFIEQHHGTTLVEYFFREAQRERESKNDPDATQVDEGSFRYPGPKPQTKEAGVLMLADAVEGACRALVDPTPARIESRVRDIVLKKMLDGQFDECDLTLAELHTIETSLVKSVTAVYHGRVKYPDQQAG